MQDMHADNVSVPNLSKNSHLVAMNEMTNTMQYSIHCATTYGNIVLSYLLLAMVICRPIGSKSFSSGH